MGWLEKWGLRITFFFWKVQFSMTSTHPLSRHHIVKIFPKIELWLAITYILYLVDLLPLIPTYKVWKRSRHLSSRYCLMNVFNLWHLVTLFDDFFQKSVPYENLISCIYRIHLKYVQLNNALLVLQAKQSQTYAHNHAQNDVWPLNSIHLM